MDQINTRYSKYLTSENIKILGIVLIFLLSGSFLFLGRNMFVIIFLVYPALNYLLPNKRKRFLKYQTLLPTSKIGSLAMGLVEIEGHLLMTTPLTSPIKDKECIGYRYTIESISVDKYQHKTYEIIKDETICNSFFVKDDTGEIEVNPKSLEFIWVPKDEQLTKNRKRYTQYVLYPNTKMLLIGKATYSKKNKTVLEYESIKNVFAISPSNKISDYNTYKPLLNSFIIFMCFFAFVSALIIITPITIENHKINIEKPLFQNPFKQT